MKDDRDDGMRRVILTVLAGAMILGGCDGNLFARRGSGKPTAASQRPAADGAGTGNTQSAEDLYTVLMIVMTDPGTHGADAQRYRRILTEKLAWKGLFVISKGGHSELYWGRYRTSAAAQKTLAKAKAYRTQNGMALFSRAMVVPLPGKDIGPEQWKLRNAAGEYSLLVAVFKDDQERNYIGRRRFAVEYCRRLRANRYQGYYLHGTVVSHVTIGAFGAKSFRRRKGPGGPEIEILDPQLKKLRKDFPQLAVNGSGVNVIYPTSTGKRVRVPRKTYLIRIPKD
ncbi:hypothetical protein LCGC14_2471870, partial [marine sediment metagenome]